MDDTESVEATKPTKTPAQLETVKKARAKKKENDEARIQEKERLKAEARFDRLLELFDKVRVEEPPEPKRKPKPAPIREAEPEEEDEDEPVQKPKPKAVIKRSPTTGAINLRVC